MTLVGFKFDYESPDDLFYGRNHSVSAFQHLHLSRFLGIRATSFHTTGQSSSPPPVYDDVPHLEEFRLTGTNGNSHQITGIWVEGILAYTVLPRSGITTPSRKNTASIYTWAEQHGVTAFLIHNYLGRTRLYNLNAGVQIAFIYGNSRVDWYLSCGGTWYEAANYSSDGFKGPFRIWSYVDCDFDLSVDDIRWKHYAGASHPAFQTCVEAAGRVGVIIVDAYFLGDYKESPQEKIYKIPIEEESKILTKFGTIEIRRAWRKSIIQ